MKWSVSFPPKAHISSPIMGFDSPPQALRAPDKTRESCHPECSAWAPRGLCCHGLEMWTLAADPAAFHA